MPKSSQKVTNIWLFIFDTDEFGDLKLPLSKDFDMNGVNKESLSRGDRVCILVLMEKNEPDNFRKIYKTVDMWFEE